MRMLLPPVAVRKMVKESLKLFFQTEDQSHFDTALHAVMGFYNLSVPKVEWVDRFEDARVGGLTWETGKVQLIKPSVWKRNRKHNGMRRWREIALHEIGHVVMWHDAELKADKFAESMLK